MFSSIRSLGVSGIGGYPVLVEVNLSSGLPSFDIVGLPDAAIKNHTGKMTRNRLFAPVIIPRIW